MTKWLWRVVEARLRRALPVERVNHVLSDLAEDYAEHRRSAPVLSANIWLVRESRSLTVAYRRRDLQSWFDSMWQDAGYAVRSVRRRPLRLAAATVLLSLAIGLTTAMFTIVDSLILRPIPFRDADRLAIISMGGARGGSRPLSTVSDAWRESRVFAAVEEVTTDAGRIDTDSGDVRRYVASVTPGMFDLLGGVRPILGRLFDADDGHANADDHILLSEEMWKASFHADPAIVGRIVKVNDRAATIVGVLPSHFRFPEWNTAIWKADRFEKPSEYGVDTYVRFASAIPQADALRVATAIAHDADPKGTDGRSAQPRSLALTQLDASYKNAAPFLIAGVVLLFVVLCANVSSLQLAGVTARTREFATRAALGASRSRLARQAFIESALVGAAGISGGLVLAFALVSIARVWLFDALSLHSLHVASIDTRALVVTSAVGLLATLAAAFLPATLGTRVDGRSLQISDRSGTESSMARAASRALLVCQIALSCTLLLGAVMLVRSFVNLATADRGFDPKGILVSNISLPSGSSEKTAGNLAVMRAMEDEARAIPGVAGTSWSYYQPPNGTTTLHGEWASDAVPQPIKMDTYLFNVDARFFALYDIPILRGRSFQAGDSPSSIVIGERLAQALWPGADAIGHVATLGGSKSTVVGVAKEIRFPSVDRAKDAPQIYRFFDVVRNMGALSIRCLPSASGSFACPDAELVRRRLVAAAPGVDVGTVGPVESAYTKEFARPRAAAGLAFAFAVTALIAAAAGLFSLLSHVVSRRRREFGIRTALGASSAQVCRLVIRDSLSVTLSGVGIGVVAGVMMMRAIAAFLFDVTPVDPIAWVSVIGLLTLTVAAASWHPARTAIRTSPVILLRDE